MGRFKMENDRLVVTIDDLGAELVSIYDKKYSRELIWRRIPVSGQTLCAGSAWFCQRLCVGKS